MCFILSQRIAKSCTHIHVPCIRKLNPVPVSPLWAPLYHSSNKITNTNMGGDGFGRDTCFDPTFLLKRNNPSILLIFGQMPDCFELRTNYQIAQAKTGIKQWLQTHSLLSSREGTLLVTNVTSQSLCLSDNDLHKCHVLVLYICLFFYLQLPFLYSGH